MKRGSLLLVDDDEAVLFTLAANLELEGFAIDTADSGARALELLKTKAYDGVLTDIRMPGMSGLDLYRAARAAGSSVPFLMMTAFAVEGVVDDAFTEGVFAVIPKPFAIEHAIEAVGTALKRPSVLVVDAERTQADSVAKGLVKAGVNATASYDADSAARIARESFVDVCVASADLELKDLLEKLKSAETRVAIIAAVVRGSHDALKPVASKIDAAITKPVDVKDLLRLIAQTRGRSPD